MLRAGAFVGFDRRVAEDYGASVPDLIEMAGVGDVPAISESDALDRVIAGTSRPFITTSHTVLFRTQTYALLLRPYGIDQTSA